MRTGLGEPLVRRPDLFEVTFGERWALMISGRNVFNDEPPCTIKSDEAVGKLFVGWKLIVRKQADDGPDTKSVYFINPGLDVGDGNDACPLAQVAGPPATSEIPINDPCWDQL